MNQTVCIQLRSWSAMTDSAWPFVPVYARPPQLIRILLGKVKTGTAQFGANILLRISQFLCFYDICRPHPAIAEVYNWLRFASWNDNG